MDIAIGIAFFSLGVISVMCVAIFAFILVRTYQLECEAALLIEEYRSKLNGSNRFLFDEQLMRQVFPEFGDYITHRVWARLVATKAIERDTMDGTWCIK